jgi:hypothetical protein
MFISVILVVAGIIGLVVLGKRREPVAPVEAVG